MIHEATVKIHLLLSMTPEQCVMTVTYNTKCMNIFYYYFTIIDNKQQICIMQSPTVDLHLQTYV